MKKFLLLFVIAITFSACSIDDDANNYYMEVLPVENFEVPESFIAGRKYEITVGYKLPTNCHSPVGLYYAKEDNIRVIGIQTRVIEGNYCEPIETEEISKLTFNFEVGNSNSYIFKFYKGQDEEGNDVFEDVEIPVVPYEIPAN